MEEHTKVAPLRGGTSDVARCLTAGLTVTVALPGVSAPCQLVLVLYRAVTKIDAPSGVYGEGTFAMVGVVGRGIGWFRLDTRLMPHFLVEKLTIDLPQATALSAFLALVGREIQEVPHGG